MSVRQTVHAPNRPSTSRPLTVIVRALPRAAIEGRVAGEVEIVDTGEIVHIAGIDQLVDLLQHLATAEDAG